MGKKQKGRDTYKFARQDAATMLRACRLEAGLTQKQVAARLKVKQPVVSRLESGEVNMTLQTMVDFAFACGYRIDVKNEGGAFRFVTEKLSDLMVTR